MNNKQTNKLNSYAAVEAVLKSNPEVANVPGLPARMAKLGAKMDEIRDLVKTQTQPIHAATSRRDQIVDNMTGTALEVAGFVTSVARDKDRTDLRHIVGVTSDFRRARQSLRLVIAQRVLDAAREVLPDLPEYGVTGQTLDDLEARIKAASEVVALPRSTIVSRRGATTRLVGLFEEVDILLKDQIDRLVFPLRKTALEFYARYKAARSIVDRPGSRSHRPEEVAPPAGVTAPIAVSSSASASLASSGGAASATTTSPALKMAA